ncbi:lipocalin-like domain-containing protein [Sinomicrobium sp. M5D2P17]
MTNRFIKEEIVGTWKLLSWVYYDNDNKPVHYFGESVEGILMYDKSGLMNAQLMRPERPLFNSTSINSGTQEEIRMAFDGYLAYYGKYEETRPGEIVHTVEGSLLPNWIGSKQVRYVRVEGEELLICTPPISSQQGEVVFYLKWVRISG